MNKLTTLDIIKKHKELENKVKDMETATKSLRKGDNLSFDWGKDVEKDTRESVKIIYNHYKEALKSLEDFDSTIWS